MFVKTSQFTLSPDLDRMFRNMLVVILLFVSGIQLSLGSECCKTGYDDYTYCIDYCCTGYSSWSLYNRCCSSYSSQVSYNGANDSDCDGYFASHVWAAVLIGLGSLAGFVVCIVLCVCCVKACASSNHRTGAVVMNTAQPGTGMFVINNSMAQQQQGQGPPQQAFMHTQGVYPPGYGQAAYPPGFAGPSSDQPPAYHNPGFEKAGGVPPS